MYDDGLRSTLSIIEVLVSLAIIVVARRGLEMHVETGARR
jgi:hypothetical protein